MKLHHCVTRRWRFEATWNIPANPFWALDAWRWSHHIASKRRDVFTHWLSVISQKNGILSYTAVLTFRTATEAQRNISVALPAGQHVPRAILQPYSTAELASSGTHTLPRYDFLSGWHTPFYWHTVSTWQSHWRARQVLVNDTPKTKQNIPKNFAFRTEGCWFVAMGGLIPK
jgi:hypothetical protein